VIYSRSFGIDSERSRKYFHLSFSSSSKGQQEKNLKARPHPLVVSAVKILEAGNFKKTCPNKLQTHTCTPVLLQSVEIGQPPTSRGMTLHS